MSRELPTTRLAPVDEYGPHAAHVENLLSALADPHVRRRPIRGYRWLTTSSASRDAMVASTAFVSDRTEQWDIAQTAAARVAVPSQRHFAAGTALAIVLSDLIDDATWTYLVDTPLASRIAIERPTGPLSERCPCGHQLGQRLLACKLKGPEMSWRHRRIETVPACGHTTPSLPTPKALEIATSLVQVWDGPDWVSLVEVAARLTC